MYLSSVTNRELQEARAAGSLAAARELRRLKVDLTRQIDIFAIIENAGLWLLFQPMDGLLGTYLPGGILINTERPRSVQRLTAAHEYGHYTLKHEGSIDDSSTVEQTTVFAKRVKASLRPSKPSLSRERLIEEAAAQAFAMDFLMPPQLVNQLWLDLGLPTDNKSIIAEHLYRLSLFLGTSYAATLHQLAAMGKVSAGLVAEFIKYKPKQIKQSISNGVVQENSWADIWLLDEGDTRRTLSTRVGDELHIYLSEKPATGFLWDISEGNIADWREEPNLLQGKQTSENEDIDADNDRRPEKQSADIALVASNFERNAQSSIESIGVGGKRRFVFRVLRSGAHYLHLEKRRPWKTHSVPVSEFHIELNADCPTGESDNGLSVRQQPLLALAA